MTKPLITLRSDTAPSPLTYAQLDENFTNLQNATISLEADTGGTLVVSDLNGKITLVAGTGISLTGDNTAKTVTITNTSLGANSFGKIVVSGQSDVDADTTNDTLTLAAGDGISITTNASTDTVTITSTVSGVTNPLTSDLTLGNFKIIDSNSVATIQSTQGILVKSNAYANAELTIVPGDLSNALSRISTKQGDLTINTNLSGSPSSLITLSGDGTSIAFTLETGGRVNFNSGITRHSGITTAARDALTPVNGMLIYNSGVNKFQGYAGGTWVDLH